MMSVFTKQKTIEEIQAEIKTAKTAGDAKALTAAIENLSKAIRTEGATKHAAAKAAATKSSASASYSWGGTPGSYRTAQDEEDGITRI